VPRAQLARGQAVATQAERPCHQPGLVALQIEGQLKSRVSAAEVLKGKADVAGAEASPRNVDLRHLSRASPSTRKAREFQYTTPGQPLLDVLDDHALEVELIAPSRWLELAFKPGYVFQIARR